MDQNIEEFDVTIIGASIAGNYLGFLLSKTDLKIGVIEEHEKIGLPFQCAGIVSQKLSSLVHLPNDIVLNRVTIAKIVSPSGRYIKLSGNEKPYVIDRIELDRYYYKEGEKKSNITYFLGEKFKKFKQITEKKQNYVLIETTKRKIKSRLLIGCDGPLSSVGKLVNVQNDVIYATQARIQADFNQNEAVMYFDPRWKKLFGWIVPEGNNIYRVGLATSHAVKKKFNIFLKKIGVNFNNKIDQQGGIIPYGVMKKVAFNNILLLGDAAGQVKATTGGGIVMLLTAAKIAFNCIQNCFQLESFSRKTIKKFYEKSCKAKIGRQLKFHRVIRILLEKFTSDDFDSFFRIIKTSKIEGFISLYGDMDFPRAIVYKLLRNSMVLKFLIKFIKKNPNILFKVIKTLV
jgi:geranylgeranyl reductase family protein